MFRSRSGVRLDLGCKPGLGIGWFKFKSWSGVRLGLYQ